MIRIANMLIGMLVHSPLLPCKKYLAIPTIIQVLTLAGAEFEIPWNPSDAYICLPDSWYETINQVLI